MALSLTLSLPRLVRFGLCLAFCLIAYAVAEEVASPRLNAVMASASPDARPDSELSSNDLEDDPALPILFNLMALVGWVACLARPPLFSFARRWPPPLRPPQFTGTKRI